MPAGPDVTFAFRVAQVPPGVDRCKSMGPYTSFVPFRLSIDGPLVAYTGRDLAHDKDLLLGDVRDNSIRVVYKAEQPSPDHRVDIWSVQLANGSLYWLEFTHKEDDASTEVLSWVVKRMDVATRSVTEIARDKMPSLGGKRYVERITWDGSHLAALVNTGGGDDMHGWQVELWDPDGRVQHVIPVAENAYDYAVVDDGVLFTSGIPFPEYDSVGKLKLYRWTPATGTRQIGVNAAHVAGCGKLAAWVVDDEASPLGAGNPMRPRLMVSEAPFDEAVEKTIKDHHPLVSWVTCGPGIVLWWEAELGPSSAFAMTLWKPEWSAPLQVVTGPGGGGTFAAGGGWIAWFEYNENTDAGQLRAIPVSALSEANAIDPPQAK